MRQEMKNSYQEKVKNKCVKMKKIALKVKYSKQGNENKQLHEIIIQKIRKLESWKKRGSEKEKKRKRSREIEKNMKAKKSKQLNAKNRKAKMRK